MCFESTPKPEPKKATVKSLLKAYGNSNVNSDWTTKVINPEEKVIILRGSEPMAEFNGVFAKENAKFFMAAIKFATRKHDERSA